ncbi:unnamed protein product [Closterium sp. NIES-54]
MASRTQQLRGMLGRTRRACAATKSRDSLLSATWQLTVASDALASSRAHGVAAPGAVGNAAAAGGAAGGASCGAASGAAAAAAAFLQPLEAIAVHLQLQASAPAGLRSLGTLEGTPQPSLLPHALLPSPAHALLCKPWGAQPRQPLNGLPWMQQVVGGGRTSHTHSAAAFHSCAQPQQLSAALLLRLPRGMQPLVLRPVEAATGIQQVRCGGWGGSRWGGMGWVLVSCIRGTPHRAAAAAARSAVAVAVPTTHPPSPPPPHTFLQQHRWYASSTQGSSNKDGSGSGRREVVRQEEEDVFSSITDKIPERPVSAAEGASYSIVILAALAVAAGAAYFVVKELLLEPKECVLGCGGGVGGARKRGRVRGGGGLGLGGGGYCRSTFFVVKELLLEPKECVLGCGGEGMGRGGGRRGTGVGAGFIAEARICGQGGGGAVGG